MTVRPAHVRYALILAVTAACAACGLQPTTPVQPVSQEGPKEALRAQPAGPVHANPLLAVGQDGTPYLLLAAVERGGSGEILFSGSEDLGATWTEPPILLNPMKAAPVGQRNIATGPGGHVYAVWQEGDPKTKRRGLRFVRSQDRGRHWSEPLQFLNDSDVGVPRLLADHDGSVYIAALVGPKSSRTLSIVSSHDFGATFTAEPTHVTPASPTSEHGITDYRVTTDGEGRLYVVWQEYRTLADHRIYLNRSLDRGKTWETHPILVSTPDEGEQRAHDPEIVATPDGRVYVAWEQVEDRTDTPSQPGTPYKPDTFIYVNRSLDYGRTWLPKPIRLNGASREPVTSAYPRLSADRHGHVYVVWLEEDERARLVLTRSIDSGMTWSAPVRLDLSSPAKGWIAGALVRSDDAGHVWVLWQEIDPDSKRWRILLNRSEDHGKSWRNPAIPLTEPAPHAKSFRDVDFLNDSYGRLYVAWGGEPKTSRVISINRSTDFGATWLSRAMQVGQR